MKTWNYFLMALTITFLVAACSAQKGTVEIKPNGDEAVAEADSIEHELETFDPEFETWYTLYNSPAQYRSETYYETWNRQYVSAWNSNAMNPSKNDFFEPIVGWDPTVDYDFEIDHELFYYFQYVENVLGIQIMSGGPKSLPL